MPLPVFEDYFLEGKDNGYPVEHWEAVIEEYDNLTGEKGATDVKETIGRHTELILKHDTIVSLFQTLAFCMQNDIYPHKLCKLLAAYFKPLKFENNETLLDDLKLAQSKLKTTIRQINDVQELLPKGDEAIPATYFDNILIVYAEVKQMAIPDKSKLTVQQFALIYASLKKHIENNKPTPVDNG